jgi:hypothetical protein
VWQELRSELHPQGLEIVTVALDTGGAEAATRWIARARPEHPALIDQAHQLDELFGVVNVPSGVWIDEDGLIVRPPETAFPRRPEFSGRPIPADATPEAAARIAEVRKLRVEADLYVAALRDWVSHGAASRYALSPDEVIARSRPRPVEEAEAAAHFALGQHLHRLGRPRDAVSNFQAALRLQPENWTYKRQAWNLADQTPDLGKPYEGDWFSEVRKIGAENYYPKLDMEP